jgi:hypothetical protein
MPNSRKKSSLRLNQDYFIIKFMQLNISPWTWMIKKTSKNNAIWT